MTVSARLSVAGLIVFGTTTSLFAKIVYELEGHGLDGKEKLFQKPWCMTTVMFIGMSFCLPLAYWQEARMRREDKEDLEAPLLGNGGKPAAGSLRETLLLCLPAFFDLIATVLMNVGLLSVTASVYQMMRGAEMLFAALFAVLFLHRALNRLHYAGIACCALGISLVGTSSLMSGEGSSTHEVPAQQMLLGMGLIVASQAVQAAQLTFEDFFMADLNMLPMKIVGFEGVFGTLIMVCILLPAAYFLPGPEGYGLHEDSLDTLAMIRSSPGLQAVLAVDMFALLAYNVCGMMVTGHLGAVFRTVLETMRTLFVWLLGLLLFYTPLGMGKLGESWSSWSYLQALGFAVLVMGTLVYGKGDESSSKEDLDAAMEEQPEAPEGPSNGQGTPPVAMVITPALAIRTSSGTRSVPIAVSGSFKATMSIASGSYSRSLPRSLQSGTRAPLQPRAEAD